MHELPASAGDTEKRSWLQGHEPVVLHGAASAKLSVTIRSGTAEPAMGTQPECVSQAVTWEVLL